MYMDINKAQLIQEFNKHWETVKNTMQSWDQIGSWLEFMKDCWEKELPAVRDEIIKETNEENTILFKEWKQKMAFAGMSEDLDKYYNLPSYDLPYTEQTFPGHARHQRVFSQCLLMWWWSGWVRISLS